MRADFGVYLGHQVLPPIERLCEPIEGTEKARMAECLGKLHIRDRDWTLLLTC